MSLRTCRYALVALALTAGAARAQTALDRYGGGATYPTPTPQPAQKFLNWPGKVAPAYERPTYAAPAYVLPTPQAYPRTVLLNGPPQGYQPQGAPPAGYAPQAYAPQAYVIVGQPPMAQVPQVYGQQAYAPASYLPQAVAPPVTNPAAAVAAPPPVSYTAQANGAANLAPAQAPAPLLQAEAQAEAAAAGPALPQSIYAPRSDTAQASLAQTGADAAPPPQPAGPGGARYYSVHRDYGLSPDPIPLPPEAFGPTADLTQPELSDAPTARKGASKGEVNGDRLAQTPDGN